MRERARKGELPSSHVGQPSETNYLLYSDAPSRRTDKRPSSIFKSVSTINRAVFSRHNQTRPNTEPL
jgi:hypothetical protein